MIESRFRRSELAAALLLVSISAGLTMLAFDRHRILIGPQGTRVLVDAGSLSPVVLGSVLLAGGVMTLSAAHLIFEATPTRTDTSPEDPSSRPRSIGEHGTDQIERRREEWDQTAERLGNAERTIYETILDADGVIPQSEIVDRTDLSKATVSRTLDGLETKHLVERKDRGMRNTVVLK